MNIKTALIAVAVSSYMLTSTPGQASEHSSVFTPEQEKKKELVKLQQIICVRILIFLFR
jgi:hypothetical protein